MAYSVPMFIISTLIAVTPAHAGIGESLAKTCSSLLQVIKPKPRRPCTAYDICKNSIVEWKGVLDIKVNPFTNTFTATIRERSDVAGTKMWILGSYLVERIRQENEAAGRVQDSRLQLVSSNPRYVVRGKRRLASDLEAQLQPASLPANVVRLRNEPNPYIEAYNETLEALFDDSYFFNTTHALMEHLTRMADIVSNWDHPELEIKFVDTRIDATEFAAKMATELNLK